MLCKMPYQSAQMACKKWSATAKLCPEVVDQVFDPWEKVPGWSAEGACAWDYLASDRACHLWSHHRLCHDHKAGEVFNVWRGRDFYGAQAGGPYGVFAGKDATRYFAKQIVSLEEDDGQPLTAEDRSSSGIEPLMSMPPGGSHSAAGIGQHEQLEGASWRANT
eukprot:Skav202131  [mRNA]  locus=scaffold1980:297987:310124:- [translate_table: standard]